MNGWSKVKLGQVAEFINGDRGKNYPSEGDFVDQGIPFINAGHLTAGKVVFSKMNYISENRFRLLGSGKTRMNDILYCLRGSLGKTAIVRHKGDAAIASSLVIIRPSNECSVDYLYHFLTSPTAKSELHKFDNGSSQPNLSASSVKNYVLPLPPLAEQQRIAKVLDRAEALRAKRRAALSQLDTLTQAIFLDLFGDPAVNQKEWPVTTIAELCEVKGGKRLPKGEEYSPAPTQFRYIRVTDLKGGIVDESDLVYLKPDVQAKIARYIVNTGDVIISIAGSIGLVAAVPATLSGANLTENAAKLVPRLGDVYDAHFLATVLQMPFAQRQIDSHIGQVTIGKLALFRIEKLSVPLPPLSLQWEFNRRVAAVEKSKALHRNSLSQMDTLFAVLQHRAFRGELRCQQET